jgi:hypothetical protein
MKKNDTQSRENAGQIECIKVHSGAISLWFGTKVNILDKGAKVFSIFVLIPMSYVRSIVPPPPTFSRKQSMAGKRQYFFGSRAWDTQWVCNMGWLNVG